MGGGYSFELKNIISNNSHLDSLWVFGHSLGGIVTSLFAESWTDDLPITVHSIAAPLAGMKRFKDNHCRGTEKETYIAVSYTHLTLPTKA